jgi:hypothetical protein
LERGRVHGWRTSEPSPHQKWIDVRQWPSAGHIAGVVSQARVTPAEDVVYAGTVMDDLSWRTLSTGQPAAGMLA